MGNGMGDIQIDLVAALILSNRKSAVDCVGTVKAR